ncbi:MAG TPA: histidine kinase [Acidimicrobiales bacterium]|nr:histidine kinase [Acidimicrobiales bacterium]
MSTAGRTRRPEGVTPLDLAIALVVCVLCQGQLAQDAAPVGARVALLGFAVLAFRRRAPLVTALVVAASVGVQLPLRNPPSVFGEYLGVLIATYTVADRGARRAAALGGLAIAAGVIAHDVHSSEFAGISGVVSDLTIPAAMWVLGRAVRLARLRAARSEAQVIALEQEQEELAQLAAANERIHLARELHDIVTHSVTVTVIQAQAAQRALDRDPEAARASLTAIEDAGRSALQEMRRMLGLLRDEQDRGGASRPGPDTLPDLLAHVRQAGLAATLHVEGDARPLPAELGLTVYRIVQESLTNALKYAAAERARVVLRYESDTVTVEVRNPVGRGDPLVDGSGRGHLGMSERVDRYGGRMTAQIEAGRQYVVRATIPDSVAP